MAMVGDSHQVASARGRVDGADSPEVCLDDLLFLTADHLSSVGPPQGNRLLTALVGKGHDPLPVAQP